MYLYFKWCMEDFRSKQEREYYTLIMGIDEMLHADSLNLVSWNLQYGSYAKQYNTFSLCNSMITIWYDGTSVLRHPSDFHSEGFHAPLDHLKCSWDWRCRRLTNFWTHKIVLSSFEPFNYAIGLCDIVFTRTCTCYRNCYFCRSQVLSTMAFIEILQTAKFVHVANVASYMWLSIRCEAHWSHGHGYSAYRSGSIHLPSLCTRPSYNLDMSWTH